MIILVDMDSVTCDFMGEWNRRWKEKYPDRECVPIENFKNSSIEKNYPHEYKLDIEAIYNEPGFYRSLPMVPGAKEALEWMVDEGYYVYFCTKPLSGYHEGNVRCIAEKWEWVGENFGRWWMNNIIPTRDKTLVHGDILIDDNPEMIKGVLQRPHWNPVLFEQPWNSRELLEGSIKRAPRINWSNFKTLLGLIK